MKVIAHFDQHELGFEDPNDRSIDQKRRAARAVLVNEMQHIGMVNFSTTGSHKLAGGGIDEGESIEEALRREVREETGYEVDEMHELGTVEEERYYSGLHQTSYCFLVKSGKFVGTERTKGEIAEGMGTVWLPSFTEAIAAIEANSTTSNGGDQVGHQMMTLREVAILRAAEAKLTT